VTFAFEFLEKESIPVVNADVGGREPRKIYFHTDTNDVFLRRVPCRVYPREEDWRIPLLERDISKAGEITFFDSSKDDEEGV